MYDPLAKIKIQIKAILSDSIIRVAEQNNVSVSAVPDFSVTVSEDPSWGDFSSNAAFVLSDIFKLEPRKLSTQLTDTIDLNNSPFKDVACCDPGFINFRLNDDYLVDCIQSNVVFDYSDTPAEYSVIIWGNDMPYEQITDSDLIRAKAVFDSLVNIFIRCGYRVSTNNKEPSLFDPLSRQIAVFSESQWDQERFLSRFDKYVERISVQKFSTDNELSYSTELAFLLTLVRPGLPARIPDGLHNKKSKDNPAYYLRYMNSWIQSQLRGLQRSLTVQDYISDISLTKEERALTIHCLKYAGSLKLSTARCDPSIAARYLIETAKKYDMFYKKFRIRSSSAKTTAYRMKLAHQVLLILQDGMELFELQHPSWL